MPIQVQITMSFLPTDGRSFGFEDMREPLVKLASVLPPQASITDLLGQDIFTNDGKTLVKLENCVAIEV